MRPLQTFGLRAFRPGAAVIVVNSLVEDIDETGLNTLETIFIRLGAG